MLFAEARKSPGNTNIVTQDDIERNQCNTTHNEQISGSSPLVGSLVFRTGKPNPLQHDVLIGSLEGK